MKVNLAGSTLNVLKDRCRSTELDDRVAGELAYWMYKRRESNFAIMDTLPKSVRQRLAEHYRVEYYPSLKEEHSSDGTVKYLFPVSGGGYVETAFIPDGKRRTLCVSCQQGCRMGCAFCFTGKQEFRGHLAASDIVNQIMEVSREHGLTHIVFMGMGEPLDNLPAVLDALEIITSQYGLAFSPRSVTVSTVGLLPALGELLRLSRCNITLSLHSPFSVQRQQFVPAEKKHPFSRLLHTVCQYPLEAKRRVSVAYVMLKGINDSEEHLDGLIRLLKGSPCRVNLIPYHPSPVLPFRPADTETIQHFFVTLNRQGVPATIRRSRGYDIAAACGLLSATHITTE